MTELDKALKLFRDALQRSEDRVELLSNKDEIVKIEERIKRYILEDECDVETAVEAAVYDEWPNSGGGWENDPRRFVI